MTLPESDRPTFLTDWCLGKSVPIALANAGAQVKPHGNQFKQDAPDEEWLLETGKQGWVVLTKETWK